MSFAATVAPMTQSKGTAIHVPQLLPPSGTLPGGKLRKRGGMAQLWQIAP